MISGSRRLRKGLLLLLLLLVAEAEPAGAHGVFNDEVPIDVDERGAERSLRLRRLRIGGSTATCMLAREGERRG